MKVKKYIWGEDPEMSGPRNYFRESLMVSALVNYKKKGLILDAGCGSGNLSFRLAEKDFNIFSVDLAEKSLAFLRQKIKTLHLEKKITVKKASLEHIPAKENTFDGIVCGEVLEHINQDKKIIKEFYRILKKKGVCIVTVPGHPELWDISDDISGHKRRYTREGLRQKFEKVGFQVVSSQYWGFPLNNWWHQKIFLPFLERKMTNRENVTQNQSFKARLVKNEHLRKVISYMFYLDFLFNFTQKGNALFLVAKK